MLKKLLKYETKATARWFVPMYIGIFLFAILNRISIECSRVDLSVARYNGIFDQIFQFAQSMVMFLYIMIIFATFVLTFFITLQRFYKNLLGDEGYLMFTLPVNISSHIKSKLLVSVFWTICSVIVTVCSVLILVIDYNFINRFHTFWSELQSILFTKLGFNGAVMAVELLTACLISLFTGILMFYASIAVGHISGKHRILYSFIAYVVFYIIQDAITSVILLLLGWITSDSWIELFYIDSIANIPTFFHTIIIASSLFSLCLGIGYYFITKYVLSKKLNLE